MSSPTKHIVGKLPTVSATLSPQPLELVSVGQPHEVAPLNWWFNRDPTLPIPLVAYEYHHNCLYCRCTNITIPGITLRSLELAEQDVSPFPVSREYIWRQWWFNTSASMAFPLYSADTV